MRRRRAGALILALAGLLGCGMQRHREQIRQGLLTRGLHREAFMREWGPPSRTFSLQSEDAVYRARPFDSATWERPVYEVWEYPARQTCLVFDGVRLVQWQQDRTDCTPKPTARKSTTSEAPRKGQPYPPYPQ